MPKNTEGLSGLGKLLYIKRWQAAEMTLLDLSNKEDSGTECSPEIPNLTLHFPGSFSGNQKMILCGGSIGDGDGKDFVKTCYQLGSNWPVFGDMLQARRMAATILLDNDILWITGGSNYDFSGGELQSTEYLTMDGVATSGPDLPVPVDIHCMVRLTKSQDAMLISGRNNGKATWFYNLDGNPGAWTQGPDLAIGRNNHRCGVIKDLSDDSQELVVVVGGDHSTTTEILLIPGSIDNAWLSGPSPPGPTQVGITLPDRSGFLIISTQYSETHFFRLTCSNTICQWCDMELDQFKSMKFSDGFAFWVQDDFPC